MSKRTYVDITYEGGLYWELDEKIRELLERDNDSSGCCMFGKAERDLQFSFETEEEAERLTKKVVDLTKENEDYKDVNLKVFINTADDDEEE